MIHPVAMHAVGGMWECVSLGMKKKEKKKRHTGKRKYPEIIFGSTCNWSF
jgi:hypothetical protein